jgi:uncharacterized coiled-coil protein SlyX
VDALQQQIDALTTYDVTEEKISTAESNIEIDKGTLEKLIARGADQSLIAETKARIQKEQTKLAKLLKKLKSLRANMSEETLSAIDKESAYYLKIRLENQLEIEQNTLFDQRDLVAARDQLSALLDQANKVEADYQTKIRIANSLSQALESNPDYLALCQRLDDLGILRSLEIDTNDPNTGILPTDSAAALVHEWAKGYGDAGLMAALQIAVRDEFSLGDLSSIPKSEINLAMKNFGDVMPGLRAFVREMYDQTQAWFAANGITVVPLYRGMAFETRPKGIQVDGQIHPMTAHLRAASSFSVDSEQALKFAGGDYSMIMAGYVPVSQILSTAQTGFGAKSEGEIVVLGDVPGTYRAKKGEYYGPEDVYNLLNPKLPGGSPS